MELPPPDQPRILHDAVERLERARAAGGSAVARAEFRIDRLLACVAIARAYSNERVVIQNIRSALDPYFEPPTDIVLFAMTLWRHVEEPADVDLFECASWIYWDLLHERQPVPAS